MILARSVGHILSDNGFYNFGLLKGNVVIIDAGSRPYAAVMLKGEFNRKVMSKFLSNLRLPVHPTTLEKHRQRWSRAAGDMSTAIKTYDDAWLRIIADSESMHGSLEAWCEAALLSASASGENEASCVDNDKLLEEVFNSRHQRALMLFHCSAR